MLKVNFMNPFITAAVKVLQSEVNAHVTKGQLSLEKGDFVSDEVTIIINVFGTVEGQVFYTMKEKTAKKIVSALMGEDLLVFDDLAQSGISEMGNVITGKASIGLEQAGYPCNISPPTLVTREGTTVPSSGTPRIKIPLLTQFGELRVNVELKEV